MVIDLCIGEAVLQKTASKGPDGPDEKNKQEKKMKRFFIFAMILTVLLGVSGLWADIYHPGDGYNSIQECIDNAAKGETIYVAAGHYYENLEIDKTISLIGAGRDVTIIEAVKGRDYNGGNFQCPVILLTGNAAAYEAKPLNINSPAGISGTYLSSFASFGPTPSDAAWFVEGDIVYAEPHIGNGTINNVSGKIALIDRGTISFHEKAWNAQQGGAIAVIIANNSDDLLTMGAGAFGEINIPVIMIKKTDADIIKAELNSENVNASFVDPSNSDYWMEISGFTIQGRIPDAAPPSWGNSGLNTLTTQAIETDSDVFPFPPRQKIRIIDNCFRYAGSGAVLYEVDGVDVSNNISVRESYVGKAHGGSIIHTSGCKNVVVANNSGYNTNSTISIGASNILVTENVIIAPDTPLEGDDGTSNYAIVALISSDITITKNVVKGFQGIYPRPSSNDGWYGAAVYLSSVPAYIEGNTFENNTMGVHFSCNSSYTGSLPVLRNNNFKGNSFSVLNHLSTMNTALATIDAKENYWNDENGPVVVNIPTQNTMQSLWDLMNDDAFPENAVSDMVDFDPWWMDEEMEKRSDQYVAGQTYSFTVHAPNSEDGAKASIWGFYKNSGGWASGTYGTGIFENGYAVVNYTVPANYVSDFSWEVTATQKVGNTSVTVRDNTQGDLWDQFEYRMLNNETLVIDTYRIEDFEFNLTSSRYKIDSVNGLPEPEDVKHGTVEIIKPWSGELSEYGNGVYNNNQFNKKGFYRGLAEDLGYSVEIEENPTHPGFEKIHIYKADIGFDLTLFGYRVGTNSDPHYPHMWWTTFYETPIASIDMTYNPSTGEFEGQFAQPIPYEEQFCFQPSATMFSPDDGIYFKTYVGGSMDLIFTAREFKPTELYVDVPRELIPGDYTQTYSIKATELHEGLRGVKIDLMVPKADFVQPNVLTDFSLGSAFDTYGLNKMFMPVIFNNSDPDYYIYTLNGTYGGGFDGIIGKDVELLKVNLTSKGNGYYNTPNGCLIKINPDTVIMKNDQNPPAVIDCAGTTDGLVLIDDEDPNVEIDNIADYPNGMTLQVNGDGVVLPEFDLLYTDNYDLATALWVILSEDDDAPTVPGDFPAGNVVGEVDGDEELIEDWELPAGGLADGTYVLYLLVTDEAGNQYILPWEFTIDTVAPTALAWVECRTTPDANISVDLKWTYDEDNAPAFINIWVLDYAEIDGVDSHAYPEYDPTNLIGAGTITNDIDPYQATSPLGWKLVKRIPVTTEFTLKKSEWTGMERGYYYFTIYGEAANGQMSNPPATPFFRESISYWPGDVLEAYGAVNVTDMNALSWAWGTVPGGDNWNELCDVGPSTDYARRSRPMPDGKIDFDDMMMFAMNYENTDYHYYPRNEVEADPVTITLAYQDLGGMLQVNLYLDGNNGFVTGLDIPVAFGSGLSLQNVEIGDVWPENSLLLHTNENGVVTVSCAAFGAGAVIEGNGLVASLSFAVNGHDNSMQLQRMTARGWDNSEIEIVGNPTGEVANEDLVNVIPDSSYLGSVHPNPFRGSATLQYGLKEAGSVKLGIYNTRGQLVRNLMNEGKAAGTYQITWDGSDENGLRVSSGIYLFRMETADVIKTQKAMLLK